LQQGSKLEGAGQWAEALNIYQQGLREFPLDNQLRSRRTTARIHYDLERRYADSSFLKSLSTTPDKVALNIYAEVLLKIQNYYVDQPDWPELTNSGLISLAAALNSSEFRKINLPHATDEEIISALKQTHSEIGRMTVNNRNDAYSIANTTANLMNRHVHLPMRATIFEFINGAISALDSYSAFMSDNQYSETMSQIEGNFVGLGVELRTHDDHLEVVSVIKGGPASRANLAAGDRIIAVDNQSVSDVGSEKAADMLRGVVDSFVSITVERDGMKTQTVRLQRRRVEIPSVDDVQIIDRSSGVGYIRLTNFQKTTGRDFDDALWKLHQQGMKSLVVDVRGNPGGLLSAAVDVADRFVATGTLVSTKGRNPMEDYTHRAQAQNTWRVPLVVVIDENSASASEIFAAAIRDHGRGTIVGRQSYGKGSVQGIFPLNVSDGGVRLTTARFYSPLGNSISQGGVKPHVRVEQLARPAEMDNIVDSHDPQSDNDVRVAVEIANRSIVSQNNPTQQAGSLAGR
jgi:carboxyl-terminal processing protease